MKTYERRIHDTIKEKQRVTGWKIMTDKEKLELINLRKRVESQREEIKRLTAQLERQKEYVKNLEEFTKFAIAEDEPLEEIFQELTQTA